MRVVGWYHSHPHITVWPSHVGKSSPGENSPSSPWGSVTAAPELHIPTVLSLEHSLMAPDCLGGLQGLLPLLWVLPQDSDMAQESQTSSCWFCCSY